MAVHTLRNGGMAYDTLADYLRTFVGKTLTDVYQNGEAIRFIFGDEWYDWVLPDEFKVQIKERLQ